MRFSEIFRISFFWWGGGGQLPPCPSASYGFDYRNNGSYKLVYKMVLVFFRVEANLISLATIRRINSSKTMPIRK